MTVTVSPPRFQTSRPQVVATSYIAIMDEGGRWREVPEQSLSSVPYSIRMRIAPAVAKMILAERNVMNRKIDKRRVAKYVSDILQSQWHVHGQSIQFNRSGHLIDGQQRLSAVVAADVAADFMITFGINDAAVIAIDEGRARSNLDVARIMGFEGASRFGMAIAAYMLEYKGLKERRSRSDILRFTEMHQEAIKFVTDRADLRTSIRKSPIGAVLARAYYYCKDDPTKLNLLEQFITLYQMPATQLAAGGGVMAEDMAPIVLREFIERSRDKNTGQFRKEVYRKTQAALVNFLDRTPITRLYGLAEEQFPLPEETNRVPM